MILSVPSKVSCKQEKSDSQGCHEVLATRKMPVEESARGLSLSDTAAVSGKDRAGVSTGAVQFQGK